MELQNEYTVMFALRMIMKLELACQSTSNTNMVLEKKKDTLLSFDLVNTLKKKTFSSWKFDSSFVSCLIKVTGFDFPSE